MKTFKVTIEMDLGIFSAYVIAETTYHAIELAMYKKGFYELQQDRNKYSVKQIK